MLHAYKDRSSLLLQHIKHQCRVAQPKNKLEKKSRRKKKNRKICLKKMNCVQQPWLPASWPPSTLLLHVVLFPSPSPCSNMIRFTGMSKWVILFIHCSCLAPNITRRIKAAESQQEVKRKKGKCSFLSLFCLGFGVH